MKTLNRTTNWGLVALAGTLCLAQPASVHAQGTSLFVIAPPEASGGNEGNGSWAPFATPASARFQQVYDASLFLEVMPSGGLIRSIHFRTDTMLGHPFDVTIQNLQINFSTTPRPVDGLSTTFAENIGSDETVMFGPASMRIIGVPGSGFGQTFVAFRDNPFFYNPTNGNLLVDFQIYTGAGDPPFGGAPLNAFNFSGDSVSRVFNPHSQIGLPAIGQADSLGLATLFIVTPIPEPSTLALGVLGVGTFGAFWLVRRNSSKGRRNAPN